MYFSHLECSVPCGAGPFDARARHHVCPSCGMPLLARYDLAAAAKAWPRDSLAGRRADMWRYREVLPIFPGETPVTLGPSVATQCPQRMKAISEANTPI